MDRELILGAAMFVLLLVVALSIALIAWTNLVAPARTRKRRAHGIRQAKSEAMRTLFASERERRLWLWALAVVGAIYSTLRPATVLAAWLRERNLLQLSVGLVVLLVVGAVARRWVKSRPSLGEIGVALGVTAVYLMVWIRAQSPEERTHLFEYGLVAVLVHQALAERLRQGRRVPAPAVLAVTATALLGWLDEGIQAILPHRVYDLRDVGFNALAGLMAISASLVLGWARRRWGRARTG